MSWPADGKPRYVVTVITGGDISREPRGSHLFRGPWNSANPEWYVLDRADCHRICWSGGSLAEAKRQSGKRNLIAELLP